MDRGMSEEYRMDGTNPKSESPAPEPAKVVERPGGPLVGQPAQGPDGNWYDQFGEATTPPPSIDSTNPNIQGDNQLALDKVYSDLFWSGKSESLSTDLKKAMLESIEKAVAIGRFSLFTDPTSIGEKDRQTLSAYREIARENGYEIGKFTHNPSSHTASAPIKKL